MDGVSGSGIRQRGSHASALSAASTAAIEPHPLSAQGLKPRGSTLNHAARAQPALKSHGTGPLLQGQRAHPHLLCPRPQVGTVLACFPSLTLSALSGLAAEESKGASPMRSGFRAAQLSCRGLSPCALNLHPASKPMLTTKGQLFPHRRSDPAVSDQSPRSALARCIWRRGYEHPAIGLSEPLSTRLWLPRLLVESTGSIVSRLSPQVLSPHSFFTLFPGISRIWHLYGGSGLHTFHLTPIA